MKNKLKNGWIILYVIVLLLHLLGNSIKLEMLMDFSKPLLMPILIGYLLSVTKERRFTLWVLLALLFSWIGDILLMFQSNNSLFFLLGLSSFLLAHIFYIVFFQKVRLRELIRPNVLLLLIVIVYYAGLLYFLSDYLGNMKGPVRIYGLVISAMFVLAMHMPAMRDKKTGWLLVTGALLFVISDSILAINKFYRPFEPAGLIIMLTYGLAQLFLTVGAVRYITGIKQ
jgi:uncharacterized membrane protein YhhN